MKSYIGDYGELLTAFKRSNYSFVSMDEINVESTSDDKQGLEKSTTQKSHIVRMAQSMGARIVGEEKENTKIEQEDA